MISSTSVPRKTNPDSKQSLQLRCALEKKHNHNYREHLCTIVPACSHCSSTDVIYYGNFDKQLQIVSNPLLFPEHSWIILRIQRFMCKHCRRTFSIMPEECVAFLCLSLEELTLILEKGFDARHVLSKHVVAHLKRAYEEFKAAHEGCHSVWSFMTGYYQHRFTRHKPIPMQESP